MWPARHRAHAPAMPCLAATAPAPAPISPHGTFVLRATP